MLPTWICAFLIFLSIKFSYFANGSPFNINKYSDMDFLSSSKGDLADLQEDEITLRELERGICMWLHCSKLAGDKLNTCILSCTFTSKYGTDNQDADLAKNMHDAGNMMQDTAGSLQEMLNEMDEEKVEWSRQIDAGAACLEANCHNLPQNEYFQCAYEKCVKKVKRSFNNDAPSTKDERMDMWQNRKYKLLSEGLLEPIRRAYLWEKTEKRGWGNPSHSCLAKCKDHSMPAYDTCLNSCI